MEAPARFDEDENEFCMEVDQEEQAEDHEDIPAHLLCPKCYTFWWLADEEVIAALPGESEDR